MRERHYNGPVTLAQGEASVDVWLTATGRRIARPGLLSWNGRFFAVEPIASGIDLTQPVEIGLPSGGSGLIMVERGVVHAGGAFSAMFRGVGDPPGELTPDEAEPAPEDSTARASRWASGRRRWASR